MKKFWLTTYSATTALGWVALAQASGQAIDEVPLEPSLDVPATAPILAVEPAAPIELEVVPPAPAPVAEPTWTVPEPQPQTSYVEPTPTYLEEVVTPESTWEPTPSEFHEPPAGEPTYSQPVFIEEDPILNAVINPTTPEEAAVVEQLEPEDVIRDGRSFEELLSSSPESPTISPPLPAEYIPPAPLVAHPPTNDNTPLLNQLEQDLATMRYEVRAGLTATSLPLPAPQPLAIDAEFEALQAELLSQGEAITLDSTSDLELSAWDVATLGATFTRNDFNVYTFAVNFFTEDWFTADWQSLGLDTFDSELLAQLKPSDWAVDFADLETGTDALLTDMTFSLESSVLPLPSFETSGELALDFSAFDTITSASPLGVNPLTFGYQEDVLVTSVADVLQSSD
ncbi:MAG: hypothetical protein F6J87_00480 [Spirulina sp. SIO3F2]|nr:hypothetical protein [Spirulina sp. SIO3F2]